MRSFLTAGLMAAGLAGFCGAANAQARDPQPPLGEEYCVYKKLTATLDYEFVAEAYLASDPDDEDMIAVLKAAGDACTSQYGMNETQAAIASEVGIYGATADYLAEELMMVGVKEDVIDSLFNLIDEISEDDVDAMYEVGWRRGGDVSNRIKAAVLAKGVPDDSASVDNALQIVELSVFAMDAVITYMIASVEEDAS